MIIFGRGNFVAIIRLLALLRNCLGLAQSCFIGFIVIDETGGHLSKILKKSPYFWAHFSFRTTTNAPEDRCYSIFSKHATKIDLSLSPHY